MKVYLYFFFILGFTVFLFTQTDLNAQENATQETVASSTEGVQTPTSLSSLAVNPATEIIRIKEQQVQIQETLQKQEEASKAASATPVVEAFRKQIDAINNLYLIHSQQISAYENWMALKEQQNQIKAEHETLKSTTAAETISFLELNNLREQVNAEINREQSVNSKIEVADTALSQAKTTVQQRQSEVNDLQVKVDNAQGETQKAALQQELIAANYTLRAANERVILRNIEVKSENLNKEVYQARTALLKDRLERVQNNVVFTQEQLDEQLKRLEQLKFDLEKQARSLVSKKTNVDLRLQAVKNKVAQSAEPPQSLLDQRRGLELEAKAIDEQSRLVNEQIQQIPNRTEIWNKRFDVFNHKIEKPEMIQWKTAANDSLSILNQSDRSLSIDLDILQNDLITVRNSLSNLAEDQQDRKKWLEAQETQIQTTINSYRDHQNFIEITRRLKTKLVNEVDRILAVQTWQEVLDTYLKKELYSNTYRDWVFAFGLLVVFFITLIIIRWILLSRAKALVRKNPTPVYEGILDVIRRTRPSFFFVWAVFVASTYLKFTESTEKLILSFMLLALTIQGAIMASYFMQTYLNNFFSKKAKHDQASASAKAIFNFVSQLVVWSLALYLGLQCFGIPATPLITGLGIGGLAVALALQNILGDLFASLSIIIDKPFVVGDFIIMDSYMGSVEHIGIKTTRLRSLSGEQIICSNGDLLGARIRNYKRMLERRIVFPIGVTYQTPAEKLRMIPEMIKNAVERNDNVRFDRAHFKEFGDFSLNYETVYYVLTSEYAAYMDIQQNINLELYEKFAELGIEFAYPTQTLFVEKPDTGPGGAVR